MGGLSIWHWIIVLIIVVVVFGTKRLRNVGEDLGEAVKGFKKGMREDEDAPPARLEDGRAGDARREDARPGQPAGAPRGDRDGEPPAA